MLSPMKAKEQSSVTLHMPLDLRDRIKAKAKAETISVSAWIRRVLMHAVGSNGK